ncbi:hypothetical protein C0991_002613 [Blastosporella zonata]|nr:hypothetical protein C0991_002613 [Blastosporella zonata]
MPGYYIRFGSLIRRCRNHMSSGYITTSIRHSLGSLSAPISSAFTTLSLRTGAMDQLEVLPSVSRLSENVVRVLGQNPGKFTLQGTNTYIIGKANPYTLIDTAEGRTEYIPVLESALRELAKPSNSDEPDVSDIIISHWHTDHVGGIPTVLSLLKQLWVERNPTLPYKPPRLHKFPSSPKDAFTANESHNTIPSIIADLSPDLYIPAPSGKAFHDLRDTQTLLPTGLRVLHTPGHTTDSISLFVPQDRALYTADSVLGQGTAVFEDLSTYLVSLKKMLEFNEGDGYASLYPGHGPVVTNGKELIGSYIRHRLEREAQIVKVLRTPPPSIPDESDSPALWTTWTIVTTLYAAYPQSLWLPAARGVDLHLKKLQDDGVVKRASGELQHTSWELVDILPPTSPVDRSAAL